MELPIDVAGGKVGARLFRWRQTLDTPVGPRTTYHTARVAPALEAALAELIDLVKTHRAEIATLVAEQEELIGKLVVARDQAAQGAEPTPKPSSRKK